MPSCPGCPCLGRRTGPLDRATARACAAARALAALRGGVERGHRGLRATEASGPQGKLPAPVFDRSDRARPSHVPAAGPAFRRVGNAPLAAFARGLSEAVPAAG